MLQLKTPDNLENQKDNIHELSGGILFPEMNDLADLSIEDQKEFLLRYQLYVQYLRVFRKEDPSEIEKLESSGLHKMIQALNNTHDFLFQHEIGELDSLRNNRQVSVFRDLVEFLESGKTKGYVKLPTGVGKTAIFMKLIEALGLKSLIVVPTKTLVTQTINRANQYGITDIGAVFSDQKKDFDKQITVITYDSFLRQYNLGNITNDTYPFVILDEAHNSLSATTSKRIGGLNGIVLGFTATPKYSDSKNLGKLLDTLIHEMSLAEAIEEGLLSETRTIHAHTKTYIGDVKIVNGEYDIDSLSKVINNQARNIAAVELFEKGFSDSKAVFYCVSIEHAQSLEKIFQERGIPVGLVTGDTKKTDRERCFADLEEGKIRALINVKVLIEGFDVPSVNVVFNLAPTCSLVDAEQRGGRGIRLDPSNPDKVGYVIDFIDQDNDDGNSKRHILFSQILGSSVVTGISYGGKNVKKKKFTKPPRVIPKIAGLKVVTRHEEIMKITHDYERVQQKRLNKYPQQKDGWKSLDMLVDHFKNQPKGRIYKRIKSFHPGEKQVDSTDGSIKLFYPPDAYMSLASASDWEISQQKDGWKNLDMLVAEFKNHTEDDIYKRIKKYSSGEVYLDALSGKKGIFYPSSVWMCVGIELGIGYNLNIPDGYIDTIQMKYKMRYASSDAY